MENIKISIIIPSKNGRHHLTETLPATIKACQNTKIKTEIIVIDDNSQDNTLDLSNTFPQVTFLKNTYAGACSARNLGASKAKSNILLFIDNDVFLNTDFFESAMNCFNKNFFAAACCGYWAFDGRQLDGIKTIEFKRGFPRFTGNILNNRLQDNKNYLSFGVQGAYFFCSKEKFDTLGGFDILFEPYLLEETDLIYRGLKRGWHINYISQTKPLHKCGGTIQSKISPQTKFLSKRNRYIFVWKNIHSKSLLIKHIFWLILRLPYDFKAVIGALKEIKKILKARKAEKSAAVLSDTYLIKQCKEQEQHYV